MNEKRFKLTFLGWCLLCSPLIAFLIKWSYDWSITYSSLSEWQKMWIEASGVNFIIVNAFIIFSIFALGGIVAYATKRVDEDEDNE